VLLLATLGCGGRGIPELEREEQFDIGLGRLESQVDLFELEGRRLRAATWIYMRDGTFYISNGSGAKVMGFSSYGDLLLLLYDPTRNPDPVGLSLVGSPGEVASTKRAARHSLPEIAQIAVDDQETIYVVAQAAPDSAVVDDALGVRRDAVILRFDRQGRALPYLGMDGVGGTPFPPIESLRLTKEDDLVVVSRTARDRRISWFTREGAARYQAILSERQIPPARGAGAGSSGVIQQVSPDQNQPALYVLVDYSRETRDRATGTVTAVMPQSSILHRLDLRTAEFDRAYELPPIKSRKVRSAGRELDIPGSRYQLLGMVEQGHAFFLRQDNSGVYELAVLDAAGKLAEKRRLYIDDQGLTSMTFHLSSRGILSALLSDAGRAHVVWWRCDRIIGPSLGK
jgi:hypothetical protein